MGRALLDSSRQRASRGGACVFSGPGRCQHSLLYGESRPSDGPPGRSPARGRLGKPWGLIGPTAVDQKVLSGVAAAKEVLERSLKFLELEDLAARVAALEDHVNHR